ncbi:MAG: type II toxin-antitoxin system HicA family toxin [Thermodesulfovibrionales bacterium]|nr:type II toxin-antitoxin system HicA family toxin [Thermodesulfovibrionales bacterium]
MPKLPSLTPQEVINILEKKGYILERIKGSHRIYRHPETRKMVVIPYHKKDLPKGTLLEILKQAGITKKEIEKLT